MRILVICQYYNPEPFRISDVCEELVKRGHTVTVVTGTPNYPMGKIYDGYAHGKKKNETINGVCVRRCFTIGRRSGILFRLLNYYSFSISSTRYVSKLKDEFDVVFINQLSPVMMANAGVRYKNKHKTKTVLYCLDLWPESLVAGGIKRGSLLYRLFESVSMRIYTQADTILVTSKLFAKYFHEKFRLQDVVYLPQYAESLFSAECCAKPPNATIDLMFAGNVGVAQSVKTIIEAAYLTRDIDNLRWHIVGDGSELDAIRKMSYTYDLHSVVFHGRQAIEKMPQYYAMADAMLVTMAKDPIISMTLPGKVQSYMAAGKPILGAIDGETHRVIMEAQCGLCGAAEDALQLAKNVRLFMQSVDSHLLLSQNARSYYLSQFSKEQFMVSLTKELMVESI